MDELTEPLVIIVGAVCEKCGAELESPGCLEDGKSTPKYASAVRNAKAIHARKRAPDCGGRVLFATEPMTE